MMKLMMKEKKTKYEFNEQCTNIYQFKLIKRNNQEKIICKRREKNISLYFISHLFHQKYKNSFFLLLCFH
jgi:hypothetical protein